MDFRSGVKIDRPFLAALSEYYAFPALEIYIVPVQPDKFTHTHTGGSQKVDDGQIPQRIAVIPH